MSFKQYIDGQNGPTTQFRTLTTANTRLFADALLGAIAEGTVKLAENKSSAPIEGDDTSVHFKLPMGAYVIKLGNGSTRVYQPIVTFVRPMLQGDNKSYKLEVRDVDGAARNTAEAKSKEIASTKTVVGKDGSGKTKAHSQIGDNLNFMIKTPIPNYPPHTSKKKFGVQDHPTPGLTINADSVKVRIEDESGSLTKTTHYSMSTLTAEAGKHSEGFKVEFDKTQYEQKLAAAGEKGLNLIIEYTGMLNGEAPIRGGTENRAQALILSDNYDSEGRYTEAGTRPTVTKVYTYGVKLTKVDAKRKDKKLEGAQFELRRRSSKDLLKKNNQTTEVKVKRNGADGKYIVSPEGTDTIISGEEGLIQIDGLGAADTYELTEIRAPEGGYALPAEPTTIDIRDEKTGKNGPREPDGIPDDTSVIGGRFVKVDSDNRLSATLTNKKANFKLPRTGAIGAVVFGVFGVALVAVSVAVVVVHRRKARR